MEVTQILLVIVVLVLTTIISIVGVEVFLILREVRQSVRKTNKILDDAGLISESVAKPIVGMSNFLTGLKSGLGMVKKVTELLEKDEEEEKKENE